MRAAEKEADSFLIIHRGTSIASLIFRNRRNFPGTVSGASEMSLRCHKSFHSDYFKESPTYQTDLARRLGLTTATISHHMNQLVHNGFVKHRLEEKKVYYEYQPDMVEITCAQLEKLLGNASVTENPPSGL